MLDPVRISSILALAAALDAGVMAQDSRPLLDLSRVVEQADISLAGDARLLPDRIRLTAAERMSAGAVWHMKKQRVAGGFEAEFRFQFTGQGGLGPGADGMAFVLQNSGPDALAGNGQAGGFAISAQRYGGAAGIAQSIAVFLDTYRNFDQGDPSDNSIGVFTHGRSRSQRWPPWRLAISRKMPAHMKDGRPHSVRIVYQDAVMTVALDGVAVLRTIVDLKPVVDEAGSAWVGFTASTGNGFENHDVLAWSFRPKMRVDSDVAVVSSTISLPTGECLEGRSLCTPAKAMVETVPGSPGEYRVLLPGHLPWGASIPNPSGAAVKIVDSSGIVCRDERDVESCSGPSGSGGGFAGQRLLAPDASPGALVWRHANGATEFSVNDEVGKAFRDNQGYFEFRVRVATSGGVVY